MISVLLFISFSIHVVLLVTTWKLMTQIKTLKNNQPEGIIDVFETYLEEIKEENRQLQKQSLTNNQSPQDNVSEYTNKQTTDNSPADDQTHTEMTEKPITAQINGKDDKQEYESDVTLSFEANVLHLHSQGLTIEEIAKKLARGKTEVMLIVKFYNKNKQ